MIERVKSFEYHVGGQPVRVIVDGVPSPPGKTQVDKAAWFARNADRYRHGVVRAPRGHADMTAVLLTEASSAGADAGLVFLDAHGYPRLSVAGVAAAARAASQHGLLSTPSFSAAPRGVLFDTPAGPQLVRSPLDDPAPGTIVSESVPSFVFAPGLPVAVSGRTVPVDVAFSGEFFALVDAEAAGVVLEMHRLEDLRRVSRAVCAAVNHAVTIAHPADPSRTGVAGAVFTGPPRDEMAHLRTVLVSAHGAVDPSPGSTAAPGVMAVLDAMGLLGDELEFVHEGLAGALGRVRLSTRKTVGDDQGLIAAIVSEVWATGEHTSLLDHDDPFVQGLPEPRRRADQSLA